jgi:hypothetical protein
MPSNTELDDLLKAVKSNKRMILNTQIIGRDNRTEWCNRDDLWAISADELNQIKQLLIKAKIEELDKLPNNVADLREYLPTRRKYLDEQIDKKLEGDRLGKELKRTTDDYRERIDDVYGTPKNLRYKNVSEEQLEGDL